MSSLFIGGAAAADGGMGGTGQRKSDRLLFVDVETTGLYHSDRIVSLGAVELDLQRLRTGCFEASGTYLIFDPGKRSHPKAEAVHGYSDWLLRHQEQFADAVSELKPLFDRCGRIVAHNASFDKRFIMNEFSQAGVSLDRANFFCTMEAYRNRYPGRAGLDVVLARMGLSRTGAHHGAFEDAWLTMLVYLWLHDLPVPPLSAMPRAAPANLREPPPEPYPLPRRKRKTSTSTAGEMNDDAAESISVEHSTIPSFSSPPTDAQRASLNASVRPMAILMMSIARADGVVDESEYATIHAMVGSEMDRLQIGRNPMFEQDTAASLLEIDPTAEMIDSSARMIMRDEGARSRLGRWIKLVTFADGKGTTEEAHAISRIRQAIGKAKASDSDGRND